MSNSELATAPVTPGFHKATSQLSEFLGIEPRMMVDTLKKQCFPNMQADQVSDAQLAAFISVANALELNPMVPGMLYAYPGKNGAMVPVTGPDGVFKMLDERISKGIIDGYECTVFPEDPAQKPTHAIAIIYRKGSDHPSKFTAYFGEWVVQSNPNWASRPRHMIWLRALKQCARQVIHGIPFDEDEVVMGDLKDVTPGAAPERPEPPKPSTKGSRAVKENKVADAKDGAIDVATTPVTTPAAAPAEAPKAAQETPPPPAPLASEAPAAAAPAEPKNVTPPKAAPAQPKSAKAVQRSSLQDKEVVTVTVSVSEFKTLAITKDQKVNHSVTAMVSGPEFKGSVFHLGGSTLVGEDKREALPEWQLDKPVLLTLRGEFSAKQNRVVTWVDKIELPGASAASQQAAVDV